MLKHIFASITDFHQTCTAYSTVTTLTNIALFCTTFHLFLIKKDFTTSLPVAFYVRGVSKKQNTISLKYNPLSWTGVSFYVRMKLICFIKFHYMN